MSEKSTEQPGGYPDGIFYKQILIGGGWICQKKNHEYWD